MPNLFIKYLEYLELSMFWVGYSTKILFVSGVMLSALLFRCGIDISKSRDSQRICSKLTRLAQRLYLAPRKTWLIRLINKKTKITSERAMLIVVCIVQCRGTTVQ